MGPQALQWVYNLGRAQQQAQQQRPPYWAGPGGMQAAFGMGNAFQNAIQGAMNQMAAINQGNAWRSVANKASNAEVLKTTLPAVARAQALTNILGGSNRSRFRDSGPLNIGVGSRSAPRRSQLREMLT